ncbi:hypothetical protein GCM10009754_43450 [Amycolatopsis minnesotensis]|uniref:Uncharacterized protein n=1 Tax=Amycolatopsis minnesotensis TaxID=337894 RepID=A0ABP5CP31_9PSEU
MATLGGGNVGETALAIGICAALSTPDLNAALLVAVDHSGDSDSTGARYGEQVIDRRWLDRLELRDVVTSVATDLLAEFGPGAPSGDRWVARYPPD